MNNNIDHDKLGLGSYFVANYPPFEFWPKASADRLDCRLNYSCESDLSLGIYVHIPFCRRRCEFCYFRVYTGKSSSDINAYLRGVIAELESYVELTYLSHRKPKFIYFGGGTPSYLSSDQIHELTDAMQQLMPWDAVEEITFECEPGTLSERKIATLRELGVTRLSLGVESFNDTILKANGRAHSIRHIYQALEWAHTADFPRINIDLIAGMVGETKETWLLTIQKTLELAPDSVTIYQLEVPSNTFLHRRLSESGSPVPAIVDWTTKRAWVAEARAMLIEAGYTTASAYTLVKNPGETDFLYRDSLWHGSDLIGLGVASFGHFGGMNAQNEKDIEIYLKRTLAGELPISRSYDLTADERLIRELVLQLKTGRVERAYFRQKFGHDPAEKFAETLAELSGNGVLLVNQKEIIMSDHGLLIVDEMVRRFFLKSHRRCESFKTANV